MFVDRPECERLRQQACIAFGEHRFDEGRLSSGKAEHNSCYQMMSFGRFQDHAVQLEATGTAARTRRRGQRFERHNSEVIQPRTKRGRAHERRKLAVYQ